MLEKGNRGFLNFYFKVKHKESPNDKTLFYEDLRQILESSKCYLQNEEIKEIFREYSLNHPKMKSDIFIEHLIPYFNKAKTQKLELLFDRL